MYGYSDLTFSCCATSLRRARINESIFKKKVTSVGTALLAMQGKSDPYHLDMLLFCLTTKSPNISTLQSVDDAVSFNIQTERFTIFCSNLPLSLQHSMQLKLTFFTVEFATAIQCPIPLTLFKVNISNLVVISLNDEI